MSDTTPENLKTQDYSEKPRKQVRYEGQISAVRYLDPQDRIDATRLREIFTSPAVRPWMEELDLTDQELLALMGEQGPTKNRRYHLFAVSASQKSKPESIGEIQGFVRFYFGPEEREETQVLVEDGLVTKDDLKEKRLLEISFAKSPDTPPGRMVGGIMQACLETSKRMQREKDKDPNNIMVLAYIVPENTNSIRAVEAAGFIDIGTVSHYGKENKPNKVYKLSWALLHQKMQSDASNDASKFFNSDPA